MHSGGENAFVGGNKKCKLNHNNFCCIPKKINEKFVLMTAVMKAIYVKRGRLWDLRDKDC